MKRYKTLRVITNFSCDQRCTFCYQKRWDGNFIAIENIEEQLRKHDIDIMRLRDHVESVTIMGGEPTLLRNKLNSIVYIIRRILHIDKVNLNTNGNSILRGDVTTSLMTHLSTLTFDVALGQSRNYEQDLASMYKKIGKAYDLMRQFNTLTIKFNHVYSYINQFRFEEYFESFMQAIKCLPRERVRISVCEDINNPKENYNVHVFAAMQKLFNAGQKDSYVDLRYGKYRIAYFAQELYNDTDLIVWKDGITDKFSEYLKVATKESNANELHTAKSI